MCLSVTLLFAPRAIPYTQKGGQTFLTQLFTQGGGAQTLVLGDGSGEEDVHTGRSEKSARIGFCLISRQPSIGFLNIFFS